MKKLSSHIIHIIHNETYTFLSDNKSLITNNPDPAVLPTADQFHAVHNFLINLIINRYAELFADFSPDNPAIPDIINLYLDAAYKPAYL